MLIFYPKNILLIVFTALRK